MKRITLSSSFLFMFFFLQAQEQSPWYFTFSAGKELTNHHFNLLGDQKTSVYRFGLGYEYPLSKKWSLMSELNLNYTFSKWRYSSLESNEGESLGLRTHIIRSSNIQLSLPLSLKYQLTERLSLTGGVSVNYHLFNAGRSVSSLQHNGITNYSITPYNGWSSAIHFDASMGLQYKINEQFDLRFDIRQPIWGNSLKGLGNGFFGLRPQISAGINYRFGKK